MVLEKIKSILRSEKVVKGQPVFRDRFHKFYELNKERINEERRTKYKDHVRKGLCVRCSKKSVKGIKLCKFHQEKQKQYNKVR